MLPHQRNTETSSYSLMREKAAFSEPLTPGVEEAIQGFELGNVLRIQVALVVVFTTKVIFEAQAVQHRIDGITATYLVQPDGISVGFGDEINLPEETAHLPVLKDEPQFLTPVQAEGAEPSSFHSLPDTDSGEAHEDVSLSLDRRKQGDDQEYVPKLLLVELLPGSGEPEVEYSTPKSMWNHLFHSDKSGNV